MTLRNKDCIVFGQEEPQRQQMHPKGILSDTDAGNQNQLRTGMWQTLKPVDLRCRKVWGYSCGIVALFVTAIYMYMCSRVFC